MPGARGTPRADSAALCLQNPNGASILKMPRNATCVLGLVCAVEGGKVLEKAKSIKEIARLAGVSTATVSRVINQNGRFSRETEERVRRIIRQQGYTPNMSAKGLRTSRTQVIGIIVPDITNPHFANLVLNLEMNLFQHGYSCLICNTNESEELEKKHIRSLTAQNVRGIVLISGIRNYIELSGTPVVYLDRPSHSRKERTEGVMIESDNEMGGYLATHELIGAGCRRIAILKCLKNDDNQQARYKGFQRALAEAGLPEDTALCVDTAAVSMEEARTAVERLLRGRARFDGIMSTTDTMAVGAVIGLRESGLEVPGDVLVTGFDDCQLAAACGPGLTSVHQDVPGMSRLAADLLLQMMEGRRPEKTHYRLPVRLTVRRSTRREGAPPPATGL